MHTASTTLPSSFLLLSVSPPSPSLAHLLAVLQDALLGADAALGGTRVGLPLAGLHVDVHVEPPAEHGHLRFRQETASLV